MEFIDLLKLQGDKATLNEVILAAENLPKRITRPIPKCLYHEDGPLDREVFRVLAWVRALRDAAEISIEEVGARIGFTDKAATNEILKEVIYFFTSYTREEIEADFEKDEFVADAKAGEDAPSASLEASKRANEVDSENPTQAENQDIASETS